MILPNAYVYGICVNDKICYIGKTYRDIWCRKYKRNGINYMKL